MYVFCVVLFTKIYGPFSFEGNAVTGHTYLERLKYWLFPLFNEDLMKTLKVSFCSKRENHHIGNQVCRFLIETLALCWIGHTGPQDLQTLQPVTFSGGAM